MSSVIVNLATDAPVTLAAGNLQNILNDISGINVTQAYNAPTGHGYVLYIDTNLSNIALTSQLSATLGAQGMTASSATVTPVSTAVQQQAVDNSSALPSTIFGFPSSYVLIGGAAALLFFMMKEK